jgi:hypothetical protein
LLSELSAETGIAGSQTGRPSWGPLHPNTPTPPLNGHHRQNANSSDSHASWCAGAGAAVRFGRGPLEGLQKWKKERLEIAVFPILIFVLLRRPKVMPRSLLFSLVPNQTNSSQSYACTYSRCRAHVHQHASLCGCLLVVECETFEERVQILPMHNSLPPPCSTLRADEALTHGGLDS